MSDTEGGTLVEQIADDFRSRIKNGDYGNEGILPSIASIAKEWKTIRVTVTNALLILRSEGLVVPVAGNRYKVAQLRIILPGLTPNFITHLQKLGLKTVEENLVDPVIASMPPDVAILFMKRDGDIAIPEGVHVVHRSRLQGTDEQPLRIGHIWYPVSLASVFVEQMRQDPGFDTMLAIKQKYGVSVDHTDLTIQSRPPTFAECETLKLARFQPVFEVRRINYSVDNSVVALHRTIADATRFEYRMSEKIDYWK